MKDLVIQLVENNQQIASIEKQISERIAEFQNNLAAARERDAELRDAIKNAAEKSGVFNYEDESIKITYVKPSQRTGVDLDKLRTFYPDAAKECEKITNVKSSVRIKVK